uniref:Uncharacterized protein n=1 Tax=Esox lucius TaxID=8010 RepID=A0A3P8XZ82_ESOLU
MKEIDNTKSIPELERSESLWPHTHTHNQPLNTGKVVAFLLRQIFGEFFTFLFLSHRILCRVLGVDIPEPRRGVLLELYVHTVLFCRKNNYNREQTSALLIVDFAMLITLKSPFSETPINNMDHCFAYCSDLLLCHSVRRPPFSICLFSSEEVTGILKHLLNTYFRHYSQYKYIFTPQVRLDLSFTYSGMPDEDSVTEDVVSAVATWDISYPSPKSDLRTIIQQEIRKEIMHMKGQLEQRLKESTDELNSPDFLYVF